MAGPLTGTTIVELAGIGPGPFAGMLLADLGADVIRVERPGGNPASFLGHDVLFRSRRCIAVDLKRPEGVEVVLRLVDGADALFEGNRPGVAERLGVGPDVCLDRNPKLVYGRMTGWGQDGPMASTAGHDINYIALSGALDAVGRRGGPPVPPLNMLGDFGGGGMVLVMGLLAALLHAERTGEGQVIDAAMVEGAATLLAMQVGMRQQGLWALERGTNLLDTGAHFYDTYETADGRWISLGAIEPQFYALFLQLLDLTDHDMASAQIDASRWEAFSAVVASRVREKTLAEWDAILTGTDVCYAPVLTMDEAPTHPHNAARKAWLDVDGSLQPRPVPRFSATPTTTPTPSVPAGTHTRAVLADHGFAAAEVDDLLASDVVAQS